MYLFITSLIKVERAWPAKKMRKGRGNKNAQVMLRKVD